MLTTINFWFKNARPTALPQSMFPAVLAFCMASGTPQFSWWLGVVAIIGIFFSHLAINLFDDYFDYRVKTTQARENLVHRGMRARIAKCAYLTSGAATLEQLLRVALLLGACALLCSFVIFFFRGPVILVIAILVAFLGISYSGSPLRLSYLGLGELQIGLMFGPMLMSGLYFSATGSLSPTLIVSSFSVGLLVANVVYTHSIMDFEPDKEVGKMTFAVLLGSQKRMLTGLFIILFLIYASMVGSIWAGYLSPYYLFVLLTLPMVWSLGRLMIEFVRNPKRSFAPRFWMGPMANWSRIQSIGTDWFMLRWYLARNLLAGFCIICIVVTLYLKF